MATSDQREGMDRRPVPDPTILTTQQLDREINSLREVLETRMAGMDKAIVLLQAANDKIPSAVDEKIHSLREIQEEKFSSVQTQFKERDTRSEQTSKDSKVAVDAALQAAKEAVGEQNKSSALAIAKSETSTVKQIDQLGVLIQTTSKALDDKIADIKDRLTRIEGKGEGVDKSMVTQQAATNSTAYIVFAALGLLVGIAGILAAVFRQ